MMRAAVLFALLSAGAAGCSSLPQSVQQAIPHQAEWAKTQFTVAQLHERQGKLQKAQEIYRELERRDPKNAEVCHRLGVVICRQGDHAAAIEQFQRARRLDPHSVNVLNDLGYAYFLAGNFEEAEQTFREALEEDPADQRALNNLASLLGHQGRFDECFALYRRNLSEAESHANLAYVHLQRGEGQAAIQHYGRALTLDGSLRSASVALAQLAEKQQQSRAVAAAEAPQRDAQLGEAPSPREAVDRAVYSDDVPEQNGKISLP
jgi:tetratricopeptide (TPR) repeat protein